MPPLRSYFGVVVVCETLHLWLRSRLSSRAQHLCLCALARSGAAARAPAASGPRRTPPRTVRVGHSHCAFPTVAARLGPYLRCRDCIAGRVRTHTTHDLLCCTTHGRDTEHTDTRPGYGFAARTASAHASRRKHPCTNATPRHGACLLLVVVLVSQQQRAVSIDAMRAL